MPPKLDESLQEEDNGITDAEGKDSSEQLAPGPVYKEALANDKVSPAGTAALKGESGPLRP